MFGSLILSYMNAHDGHMVISLLWIGLFAFNGGLSVVDSAKSS